MSTGELAAHYAGLLRTLGQRVNLMQPRPQTRLWNLGETLLQDVQNLVRLLDGRLERRQVSRYPWSLPLHVWFTYERWPAALRDAYAAVEQGEGLADPERDQTCPDLVHEAKVWRRDGGDRFVLSVLLRRQLSYGAVPFAQFHEPDSGQPRRISLSDHWLEATRYMASFHAAGAAQFSLGIDHVDAVTWLQNPGNELVPE
jgi:hypothetical protein